MLLASLDIEVAGSGVGDAAAEDIVEGSVGVCVAWYTYDSIGGGKGTILKIFILASVKAFKNHVTVHVKYSIDGVTTPHTCPHGGVFVIIQTPVFRSTDTFYEGM